jgi:hypothetical protein
VCLLGAVMAWALSRHVEDVDETIFYRVARLGPPVPPGGGGGGIGGGVGVGVCRAVHLGRTLPADAELPRYFKYKESLLVPIRSQGKCASCWAFAICDMLADRVSVYTGGVHREALSVQEMVACFQPRVWTCRRGGVPEVAYAYPMYQGLLSDGAYPYVQEKNRDEIAPCRTDPAMWAYVVPDPRRHETNPDRVYARIGSAMDLCGAILSQEDIERNIRRMKAEILTRGPIVGTIMVYDDLYKYDAESVYTVSPTASLRGGHAIVIFGWSELGENTEEAGFGGRYWIARNSWGKQWPKRSEDKFGYFYVRMGTNEAGIESRASACDPLFTARMDALHALPGAARPSVCYMSYTDYVQDPERSQFFGHLKARRIREGRVAPTATTTRPR